jgi:hypothetical protein
MLEGKDCREGRRVELALALGLVRDEDCCCMLLLLLASVSICATALVAKSVAD